MKNGLIETRFFAAPSRVEPFAVVWLEFMLADISNAVSSPIRTWDIVLYEWTTFFPKRTVDAAVARFWLQHDATAFAVVEVDATVERHRFDSGMPTSRAGQCDSKVGHRSTRASIMTYGFTTTHARETE